MKSLAEKAELLNALTRRRLVIEAAVRTVDLATPLERVRELKREHARVVRRIQRLEGKLK